MPLNVIILEVPIAEIQGRLKTLKSIMMKIISFKESLLYKG